MAGNFGVRPTAGFLVPSSAVIPFANNAARDVWGDANKSDLVQNITVIAVTPDIWYLWQGDTNPASYVNTDWSDVTPILQGPAGANGATGNSFFFPSIAARDTFFGTGSNSLLLETGLPVTVNTVDVTTQWYWFGVNNPVVYDADFFAPATIGSATAGVQFGNDETFISSGFNAFNADTLGGNGIMVRSEHDSSGSDPLSYWQLGAQATFPVSTVGDTILTTPQTIEFNSSLDSYTTSFFLRPASSGTMRLTSYYGVGTSGPVLVDTVFIVTVPMVGVLTEFTVTNETLALTGDITTMVTSGVNLYGGLQITGPLAGQTCPLLSAKIQIATSRRILTEDDTTALLADSLNRRYLTDAQLVVVGNTSGTNTGDNAVNTTSNAYADTRVQNALTPSTTVAPSTTQVVNALALKSDLNTPIVGATKTKITYDADGFVTAGADATTADIADSLNKRYVTDAQLVIVGNTSGTNSGNETAQTIGTIVNGAAAKSTPLDADLLNLADVSAGNILKKFTWANLKSVLKIVNDALYLPLPAANGIAVRTSATTAVNRTLTGVAGLLDVANGDGVAGNPTLTPNPDSLNFITTTDYANTSTTYVSINAAVRLTGLAAGRYLVMCTAQFAASSSDVDAWLAIFAGTVGATALVTGAESPTRPTQGGSTLEASVTVFGIATLTAGQIIEPKVKSASGSVTSLNCTITALRVG